ncbi:septin homolog spn2-like [Daphnia pulicaria]|uniref:septin homolog spn2-like n=1 Tax=Daphnia pulicaria TaxID=35523 RepID=UPI001EEAE62E|nr:septin homolog spn2-like [Daphnia pulicaria]XP_046658091.1 septin homolog spn2-like [Daphnia pulicaria]
MSAEGGRSNIRFAVHELTRQFGRPETTNSPVSGPVPAHQKSLPKILSHIAKTPPAAAAAPENTDNINHSFGSVTGSNGLVKPHPADHADDNKKVAKEEIIDEKSSSSESESDESPAAPNPVTSIAQIRPTLRQPPAAVQPSKIQSSDYVIGLDQLQEQVRRLALRRGFTLNIMVVGRSGLGKSTLINTLFRSSVLPRTCSVSGSEPAKTAEIRTTQTAIHENGIRLDLTVTDTPGYGDRIDNTNCWEPALEYINEQYEKYLIEEQGAERTRWIHDTRVHCCLYFIPPTGHGLRPLDLEVLQRLHNVVNIIPVIAKADTLTLDERQEFKKNIQQDLARHRIGVYPLAKYDHPDDYGVNESYRKMVPFAVVGSEQIHNVSGRMVLGRQNGWGLVQVEDPSHCEFHHLRNLLIRNRMQDLIELTSAIHYEAFRRRRLMETNGMIDMCSLNESHI